MYRDIKLIYMDPAKSVIRMGDLATLVRIDSGQVGGAVRLETNEFELFKSGKTIILDNKEWASPIVVERRSKIFNVGKFIQYVTIEEGYVASISRKDGHHFLLSEPGTYVLKHSMWDFSQTNLQLNIANFDMGPFIIRTIDTDHVGVAKDRWTSKSYILRAGKYYLHSSKWLVDVQPIGAQEVYIKPFTFVQVGTTCYVGARNLLKGSFDEFHEEYANKIIVLHETRYSNIVQVPKISHSVLRFGPWFTLSVQAGKVAMFDRHGVITMEGSGEKRLSLEDGVILEPLPTVPQIINLESIDFLSSDDYELGINVMLDFDITNHISLSTMLRARAENSATDLEEIGTEFVGRNETCNNRLLMKHHDTITKAWSYSFQDFQNELKQLAKNNLLSLLRTYPSTQLIIGSDPSCTKELIEANITKIASECHKMLESTIDALDMGIKVKKIHLLGGFRFTDSEVINLFKARTREATRADTMIAVGKSNEAKARAQAAAAIEKTKEENTIKTLKLEEARKHEAIHLETLKLKTEQEVASEQLKRAKELESQRLEIEQENRLALSKAENEARIKEISLENWKRTEMIKLEAERAKAEKELELEKKKCTTDAEVALIKVEASAEREKKELALKLDKEKKILEIKAISHQLALEKAKVENEIAQLSAQLQNKLLSEKVVVDAESIRALADAEKYRQHTINEAATKRPQNLDVENYIKLQNEAIKHFGNAAWRHPDAIEAMVGIKSAGGPGGKANGDLNAVLNHTVTQAIGVMQMDALKKLKKEDKTQVLPQVAGSA
jgi:hypothetical protein